MVKVLPLFLVVAGTTLALPNMHGFDDASFMTSATKAFLATLDDKAKAKVSFKFEDKERFNWHFFPKDRKGLSIKDMTAKQRKAAHALLRSGLSHKGYLKANGIVYLEDVIRQLEKGQGKFSRDWELYHFWIFGAPGGEKPWAWRFEGHHISINITIVNNKIVTTTPAFLGANPHEIQSGPRTGLKVLGAEEQVARKLLASLNATQKEKAVISDQSPKEIVTAAKTHIELPKSEGIAYSDLPKEQQDQLIKLLKEYTHNFKGDLAEQAFERIKESGLDKLKFAWAGSAKEGEAHYYKIQGSTFIVEYVNFQKGANHSHCVWRDPTQDYGGSLLSEHAKADH